MAQTSSRLCHVLYHTNLPQTKHLRLAHRCTDGPHEILCNWCPRVEVLLFDKPLYPRELWVTIVNARFSATVFHSQSGRVRAQENQPTNQPAGFPPLGESVIFFFQRPTPARTDVNDFPHVTMPRAFGLWCLRYCLPMLPHRPRV